MLPAYPTSPPWYRQVLRARWAFHKTMVTLGRSPVEETPEAGLSGDAASPLTGGPIPERIVADGGSGYALADSLSRYSWVLQHLDGKRFVDIGCGTGYGAHIASWVATSTTGLDFSHDAIAYAQSRYDGIEFRQVDLMTIDALPEGDVATCFEVLEHLPDPDRVMRMALGTYERVFFSVPNPWWHNSQLNPHHIQDLPSTEWRRRLHAAGAKRVSIACQTMLKPEIKRGWRPRASSWIFDCSA